MRPLTFLLIVIGTNAITVTLGVVEWFGVAATAGTWLAGFALVARDAVHDRHGPRWVAGCILAGAMISAAFSPALALASAAAFLLSELADFAIYAPLRQRGHIRAAIASNVAGSIVDSLIFLAIAGFPLTLIWGQVGIKVATTTVFVLAIGGSRALLRQPLHARRGGVDAQG